MARVIRWVDEESQKKWIHPLEVSIYSAKPLKKVVGKKTRVVGHTKVHIPNPLHPIVPYNVLILEDEHGHRMPKKTIRDYQIGDVYEDVADSGADAVSVVKIKYDFEEAVDEAIELIGGLAINPGSRILIKPNLSIPGPAYLGMCTNPKVIEAIIQYLLKHNLNKEQITVAEQSFFAPFEKAVEKSGVPQLVQKYGLNFMDLAISDFQMIREREFTFEISSLAFASDIIINVPVIKTDMYLGIDGAFENLTRFLSKKTYDELAHNPNKAGLALATFPKIFKNIITIGDGSIGMQGNGPAHEGEPGFYNLITAARNMVVHDTAVQEILCLKKLPYVELAGRLGYGEHNISKIRFVGNELNALKREIKQPLGSRLLRG